MCGARNIKSSGVNRQGAVLQRDCRQFVHNECQQCRRQSPDAHTGHRDPDASAESPKIVIGCKQYGQQITEERRGSLRLSRDRPDEIVRTAKRRQSERELASISVVVLVERDVIAVSPEAIASRFLTR